MLDWISIDAAKVGVFDATNTTIDRRRKLRSRCQERGVNCLFIESVCDDPAVLEQNISLKLQNSDYRNVDPLVARVRAFCMCVCAFVPVCFWFRRAVDVTIVCSDAAFVTLLT